MFLVQISINDSGPANRQSGDSRDYRLIIDLWVVIRLIFAWGIGWKHDKTQAIYKGLDIAKRRK